MGTASITHEGRVFRFRTNPNSIKWNYAINTKVYETYAGRVVQILSLRIEDLTVTADAGGGGWDYMMQVVTYFRDLLVDQRLSTPAVFEYPERGYKLSVYATAMPFRDQWNAVERNFTMSFRVQADINSVISTNTISAELSRLQEGIGYERNEFNFNPDFTALKAHLGAGGGAEGDDAGDGAGPDGEDSTGDLLPDLFDNLTGGGNTRPGTTAPTDNPFDINLPKP